MKILVTGGNGQLGRELFAISNNSGHEFLFIDQAELDLSKIELIKPFLQNISPDIVINCAAYTHVDNAEEEVNLAELINSEVPKSLSEYCKDSDARLIHISTDYVFDGKFHLPISENEVTNPLSVYGQTKLKGEQYINDILDNAYILRTSWLYSIYGNNFVKTMIRLGSERSEISVIIDQIGTPTHAKDLAEAIMVIIDQMNSSNDKPGIYHFSNEGVCSWYDFAVEIFRQRNIDCKVKAIPSSAYPTKAKRPFYSVLDKTKFKSHFNKSINHWSDSLRDYFNQ